MPTMIAYRTLFLWALCAATVVAQETDKPKDDPAGEAVAAVEAALEKATKLEFVETPLSDVAAYLEKLHDIDVVLDQRSLEDSGLSSDAPITSSLSGIRLRSALNLMLGDVELTYVIRDGALVITSPEDAEASMSVHTYVVADLLKPSEDQPDYDYAPLVEVITSQISPETWDEVGGPGSIQGVGGNLVVLQSLDGQKRVRQFLAAYRLLRKQKDSGPENSAWHPLDEATSAPAIRAALEKKTPHLEFIETPLSDVANFLQDALNITIKVDGKALHDLGLDVKSPITISAKRGATRDVLQRLLRPLDLTYIVAHEALIITTMEEAWYRTQIRFYPINKLANGTGADRDLQVDELIWTISSTIDPDSWDDVGGPGSLSVLNGNILVVSQIDQTHRKISKLLADLHQQHQLPAPAPNKLIRRVYRLYDFARPERDISKEVVQDLQMKINVLLPGFDKPDGAYAMEAAGTLVVMQTRDGHRQLEKLLQQLGLFSEFGSWGGGGPPVVGGADAGDSGLFGGGGLFE